MDFFAAAPQMPASNNDPFALFQSSQSQSASFAISQQQSSMSFHQQQAGAGAAAANPFQQPNPFSTIQAPIQTQQRPSAQMMAPGFGKQHQQQTRQQPSSDPFASLMPSAFGAQQPGQQLNPLGNFSNASQPSFGATMQQQPRMAQSANIYASPAGSISQPMLPASSPFATNQNQQQAAFQGLVTPTSLQNTPQPKMHQDSFGLFDAPKQPQQQMQGNFGMYGQAQVRPAALDF
jgi:hypothetical protein